MVSLKVIGAFLLAAHVAGDSVAENCLVAEEENSLLQGLNIVTNIVTDSEGLRVVSDEEWEAAYAAFQAAYPDWRDALFAEIAEHTHCRERHTFARNYPAEAEAQGISPIGACAADSASPVYPAGHVFSSLLQAKAIVAHRVTASGTTLDSEGLRVVSDPEWEEAYAAFQAAYPDWRDALFAGIQRHTHCRERHTFARDNRAEAEAQCISAVGPCAEGSPAPNSAEANALAALSPEARAEACPDYSWGR